MARFQKALNTASHHLKSAFRRDNAPSSTLRRKASSLSVSEEDISRYVPGGFHPVLIGDAFDNGKYDNGKYRVLSKLGYGVYSTVWLAYNTQCVYSMALHDLIES